LIRKNPSGVAGLKRFLKAQGNRVVARGKRYFVADFEKHLYGPAAKLGRGPFELAMSWHSDSWLAVSRPQNFSHKSAAHVTQNIVAIAAKTSRMEQRFMAMGR
jgi:hypothetical protein